MLWILALVVIILFVLLPVFIFMVEVGFAMLAKQKSSHCDISAWKRPKIAVLIPAHNEEKVIEATLVNVSSQLKNTDRLIVVADNCSDETAAIAQRMGAIVLERIDLVQKGKGFALEHGVQYLMNDSPDIVIVVDADCLLDEGAIDYIARLSYVENRPVQALYLMKHNNQSPSLAQRIAAFAWNIKNHARPLGLKFLGLPCQLMGTGMAFPFLQLSRVKLGSGNIVEDMQLGIDLTALGFPILFCPEAQVTSFFPESASAEKSQRKRWEHGHIGMIFGSLPPLITKALTTGNIMLLALVLDLAVPPLTLLGVIVTVAFFVTCVAAIFGGTTFFLYLSFVALCAFSITVFMAWLGYGREVLSFKDIVSLPKQMLVKLPLYLQFISKRQKKWERTERDD